MTHPLKSTLTDPELARGEAGFSALASAVLDSALLNIAGQPHHVREVEYYLHAPDHPDPFAHRHPVQRTTGRWYFHRSGDSYSGGSFKGLDLTFAPVSGYTGLLIRSISAPNGVFINGCSLCVDHILARTDHPSVASLDRAIDGRSILDPTSPIHLTPAPEPPSAPPYVTARVGLTLKRAAEHPRMPAFIMRPYRALNAPRRVKKGRLHLIIALHQAGRDVAEICAITGSPRAAIERHIEGYRDGLDSGALEPFFGRALGSGALARLHGAWSARFGERC